MLRVWLPLTKDLRQQGLSNVTVTNNGATFNSAGKLGGCYSFDGSDDFISLNGSALYDIIQGGSTPFSIAMWVYRADSTRAVLFGDYSLSGGIGFNIELSTAHKLRFYWNGSPDVNASAVCTLSTWSHVAIVYDGTKICFYVNGSLGYTYTGVLSTKTKTSGMYYIGRDSRTGTTAFNGKLNDFRIYDHALSQMEVKELSKGLVLHYPLNRQGWGQENLILHTYLHESDWWTGNTSSATVSNNKVTIQAAGEFYQKYGSLPTTSIPSGTTLTLSCYFYENTISSGNRRIYYACSPSWKYVTVPANFTGLFTSTFTTTEELTKVTIDYDTRNWTSGKWVCGPCKLEYGSIATPWCPNLSDTLATTMGLNSTTEYDCSGFCNNGTRTGTFTWTSDTPKYQVSTIFENNRIMNDSTFLLSQQNHVTLAAWVKLTAYTSDRSMIALVNQFYLTIDSSGRLSGYAYGKNPEGYHNSNSTIPLNKWTHVAIVWDDNSIKFYINGQLDKSITSTGTSTSTVDYQIRVGQEATNRQVKGNLSDIRAYVTALSADDIKSLYQNCATIDPDGTIRGQIRS